MISKDQVIQLVNIIVREKGKKKSESKKIIYSYDKYDLYLETIIDPKAPIRKRGAVIRDKTNMSTAIKYRDRLVFLENHYYEVLEIYLPSIEIFDRSNRAWMNTLIYIFNEISSEITQRRLKENVKWLKKLKNMK